MLLRLASGVAVAHWPGLLEELERGEFPFEGVGERVDLLLHHLSGRDRDAVVALLGWMEKPALFGVPYAAATWGSPSRQSAALQLARLERAGVVERLVSGDPLDVIDELWRVLPVVATLRRTKPRRGWLGKMRFALQRGALARRLRRYLEVEIRIPWQFVLASTLWWSVNVWREFLLDLPSGRRDGGRGLTAAVARWQEEGEVRGQGLPLEYSIRAYGRMRVVLFTSLLTLVAALALAVGLWSGAGLITGSPLLRSLALYLSALPLWLFLLLMVGVWIASQAYLSVPHLWLLHRIGVEHRGLAWIVRQARRWGMGEEYVRPPRAS